MKQGSILTSVTNFSIFPSSGRKLQVKEGQRFMVTSPEYKNTDGAMIDREKSAKIGTGYYFTTQQIKEVFKCE
jgi:gas vesicle protein